MFCCYALKYYFGPFFVCNIEDLVLGRVYVFVLQNVLKLLIYLDKKYIQQLQYQCQYLIKTLYSIVVIHLFKFIYKHSLVFFLFHTQNTHTHKTPRNPKDQSYGILQAGDLQIIVFFLNNDTLAKNSSTRLKV